MFSDPEKEALRVVVKALLEFLEQQPKIYDIRQKIRDQVMDEDPSLTTKKEVFENIYSILW